MVDNRFPTPGTDARFPSPGTDVRFATLGLDVEQLLDGTDTRFEGASYGGSTFDPASLFGANTGRLYDFKTSSMFTDAGVTPAVVNDAVYRINDRSGGANHADQATLAARGILRANGIELDGTDDFYPTTFVATTGTFTLVAAQIIDAASVDNVFVGARNGTSRLLLQCMGTTNAGKLRRVYGASIVDPASATDQRGVYKSFALTRDGGTNDKFTYEDAVEIDSRLGVADGLGTSPLNWGAENNAGTAATFARGIFKGLLIIDRILTPTEISDLHTYWST